MSNTPAKSGPPSDVERIKIASNHLRGSIRECLFDGATGSVTPDDTQLIKFHGIYQQDDRELRVERQRQKLEPHYQFMVRLRLPGGVMTPAQWLELDNLSQQYANGQMRLTTRQTFQFHYVLKHNMRPLIQGFDKIGLDSRGACGDDTRNVICNTNPSLSDVHQEVYEWSCKLSQHMLWKSAAYAETWLDQEPQPVEGEEEPFYKDIYLPRKFKFGIAIPPENDVDVLVNDVALIAIIENGKLAGFNLGVGGGGGRTHSDKKTYPRIADVIGFFTPEQIFEVATAVASVQRDFGDRSDRAHARFKYTVDDHGVDWIHAKINEYLGWDLQAARPYHFNNNGDRYGWVEGDNGKWHYTVFVQNGRVSDTDEAPVLTGFREIFKVHKGDIRLTCNQNVIITNVAPQDKAKISQLLQQYGLDSAESASGLRINSIACVSFPTCGLAMAESERYLPSLVGKLEAVMKDAGLEKDPIVIRMTGCPNGCARPYMAEIGLVGKSLGNYQLYLGGGFDGKRMNKLYRDSVTEEQILTELTPMLQSYAKEREAGEPFGDFVIRKGYIKATRNGLDFYD